MSYSDEEMLQLAGLQHFAFCRRQWALIHIEHQWKENVRTMDGQIFHQRAHDVGSRELRGNTLIIHGLSVMSRSLGISGQCDVVEFHQDPDGVSVHGVNGQWKPYPVEYKRGAPKENKSDMLQLCAQAMCLEEMLCCKIPDGALFYGETRHRKTVTFDQMILGDHTVFQFSGRNRRPPLDPVNALLSFAYSLLSYDCASALESVGLDAYVGFLHRDRPGRISLALDLMEELRPCIADRFVLTLINNRIFRGSDFLYQESGAVILTDDARKEFLTRWQKHKKEIITHPYLGEKIPWGLVPYMQALLLARYLREDLEEYPPFLWK